MKGYNMPTKYWCVCVRAVKYMNLPTYVRLASLHSANTVQTVLGSACCTSSSMIAWP